MKKTVAGRKGELKLNVLQALHLVTAAWKLVHFEATTYCFSNAGFGVTSHNVVA
jgi:hypothetical protein